MGVMIDWGKRQSRTSTAYRRMVLSALSRSGPRSVHSFDLKNACALSRFSHSVMAIRWGGGASFHARHLSTASA